MKAKLNSKYGCALCGKSVQFANLVSFSKNRVKKIRKPNLHTHRMMIDKLMVKVKLCTSCKRMVRRVEKGGDAAKS